MRGADREIDCSACADVEWKRGKWMRDDRSTEDLGNTDMLVVVGFRELSAHHRPITCLKACN